MKRLETARDSERRTIKADRRKELEERPTNNQSVSQ